MKLFYAEMFFGLDWEEITSYREKISRKQIIVCTTKVLRKRQINKAIIYREFYSLLYM